MEKIYLDNAATTPLREEVIDVMIKVMKEEFGNPSSNHSRGRSAKSIVEMSRKKIAKLLNAHARQIIFTSGATEANNWIIRAAINDLKVERIITSRVEHHAVLHAVEMAHRNQPEVEVAFVRINHEGCVDQAHLVELLSDSKPTLVSLMHVNNETGVVCDIAGIGRICKQHGAWFHSDTVQSVGKTELDLQSLPVDFMVASAHKFHGPKGIGFAFIREGLVIHPVVFGGEQEKGLRPGTEAVHDIAGMAAALEFSYEHLEKERNLIAALKAYAIVQLKAAFPELKINGGEGCFYNILNISIPMDPEKASMILFTLDMKGIAVSRGSACQSGSQRPSHVLAEMLSEEELSMAGLRISFSHYNSREDIDALVAALKGL